MHRLREQAHAPIFTVLASGRECWPRWHLLSFWKGAKQRLLHRLLRLERQRRTFCPAQAVGEQMDFHVALVVPNKRIKCESKSSSPINGASGSMWPSRR